MAWVICGLLAVALFRPPRSDRALAWVCWFCVCATLIFAAGAVSIAEGLR